MARAHSGESQAREELARSIGNTAYVFALQLTSHPDTSLDIAQESALRFFKHLDRFDATQPIEPWLYQIVRNQVRDQARRDRIRRHDSLDVWISEGKPEPRDRNPEPSETAEQHELQLSVWRAISELADAQREIIVLRDYHGLPYSEIAEVLSIPVGTVMSRLHTARKNLREIIASGDASTTRSNP
ncbi:MAG: RNA polymerase sigma factor [Actinomycetota bacterium]